MQLMNTRSDCRMRRATITLFVWSVLLLAVCPIHAANLISNPSFEEADLSAFIYSFWNGGGDISISAYPARTGSQCLKITGANASATVWQPHISVDSNTDYIASVWVYTEGLSGAGKTGLEVKSDGDYYYMSSDHQENDGHWHEVTVEFNTGDATELTVICAYEMYGNGSGTAYYDDFYLYPASEEPTPIPTNTPGPTHTPAPTLTPTPTHTPPIYEPRNTNRSTYLLYQNGSTYYAKNAITENVDYTGTDAAQIIHSIITAAGGDVTISITPGTYLMKRWVGLKSGVTIQGSRGSVLKLSYNGTMFVGIGVSDVEIRDLEIDGNRGNYSGQGINLYSGSTHNTILNNYIHDCNSHGINFSGSETKYNRASGNRIENCVGAGIGLHSSAGDTVISENYIYRTRWHGIILSTGGGNSHIVNNTIIESGYFMQSGDFAHGIACDGFGVVHGRNNIISGNVIKNPGMAGIEIADYQDYCIISGNLIEGTGIQDNYGIYFGGGLSPSYQASIVGNVVKGASGNGIKVDSKGQGELGQTPNVIIGNNVLSDNNDHGILVGIANGVVITGNICANNAADGSGNGINVQGRGASTQTVTIVGNECYDDRVSKRQGYGVYLGNTRDVVLHGNKISENKNGGISLGSAVSNLLQSNNK